MDEQHDYAKEREQICFACGKKVWWVMHADTGVPILRNADGTEHYCEDKADAA